MNEELQKLSTEELVKRKRYNRILVILLLSLAAVDLFVFYISEKYSLLGVVTGVLIIAFTLHVSGKKIVSELKTRDDSENHNHEVAL